MVIALKRKKKNYFKIIAPNMGLQMLQYGMDQVGKPINVGRAQVLNTVYTH